VWHIPCHSHLEIAIVFGKRWYIITNKNTSKKTYFKKLTKEKGGGGDLNFKLVYILKKINLSREISNIVWDIRPLALEVFSKEILFKKHKAYLSWRLEME
jgi:hypothetical protein